MFSQERERPTDKKGIPYATILGPQEKSQGKITLKDLSKKAQKALSLEDLQKAFAKGT